MRKPSFTAGGVVASLAIAAGSFGASVAVAQQVDCSTRAPIVFVHGAMGSSAQFESQALRFTSNGWDPSMIKAFEFDSGRTQQIMDQIFAGIDAAADELRKSSGCDRVNLVGHSLGTFISQRYLADPARAARIQKYVNADGQGGNALPGGRPTLSLSAGDAHAQITIQGATNVEVKGGLHVGTVAGTEAFAAMFQFFTGQPAAAVEPVAATTPTVPVSGRATLSGSNVGVAGATLSVFELDRRSGARTSTMPLAKVQIPQDGSFGPIEVRNGAPIEFQLERANQLPQSFISEGFQTPDRFVRLNTTDLSAADLAKRSSKSASLSVTRQREFASGGSVMPDQLVINGQNVINPQTVRCCAVGAAPVSLILTDDGDDGRSNPTRAAGGANQGFASSIDVAIPATGTIELVLVPRGDQRKSRTLNIQSAPASSRRLSVLLNEFDALPTLSR